MNSNYQYYNDLATRQAPSRSKQDVCSSFGKLLKTVTPSKRREMNDWFLALIHQYKIVNEGRSVQYPYEPYVSKGTRNNQSLTYNLNSLPGHLTTILLCYMLDCIDSCAKN